MQYAKRYTKRSIRKIVRNISDLLLRNISKNLELQPRNMMRNYSNNLHQKRIVQFVFYEYQHFIRAINTIPVVGKLYAVDVIKHPSMITKAMKLIDESVLSVELHFQIQKKRW